MNGRELREKTDDELISTLHSLYEEHFNLRIAKVSANLTNPSRIKQVKKDIARVKTIMNERRRMAVES
ncbi:50S ribosomal protein L29 [candidate division WOR-3 bacterium]|nr:50S ribosomal protein L29 [candidate division WOR-3 bacterium]MCK4575221.1 50S ribosomal protein L29 [candidate division WOR-3 bacterium]